MRLFLDSNLLTYIAFFEGFLTEGERELTAELDFWACHQGAEVDAALRGELSALRALYQFDDYAHFDWLFSDIALAEVDAIRNVIKRRTHDDLLSRLIEHRGDVYDEEGRSGLAAARDTRFSAWKPQLPSGMWSDGLQLAEADVVEADFFLTNDTDFIQRANTLDSATSCIRPSHLPFLRQHL